jgi:hypothetical protein
MSAPKTPEYSPTPAALIRCTDLLGVAFLDKLSNIGDSSFWIGMYFALIGFGMLLYVVFNYLKSLLMQPRKDRNHLTEYEKRKRKT